MPSHKARRTFHGRTAGGDEGLARLVKHPWNRSNSPRYDSHTLRCATVFFLARSTRGGSRRGAARDWIGAARATGAGVLCLGRLGAGAVGCLKAGCCWTSCSGVDLLDEGERRRRGGVVTSVRCCPDRQHLAHELRIANMASAEAETDSKEVGQEEHVLTCHTRGGFRKGADLGDGLFFRRAALAPSSVRSAAGGAESIARGLRMSAPLSTSAPAQLDNPQRPPFDISESCSTLDGL